MVRRVLRTLAVRAVAVNTNCWASFPTTGVLDTFTRADSSTTLGSNWTIDSTYNSLLGISSNAAYQPDSSTQSMAYWNPSTFSGTIEAYMTESTLWSANAAPKLSCFTSTSSHNGYWVSEKWSTSQVRIGIWNSGTATVLAAFSQAFSAGDSEGMTITPAGVITAWYKPSGGAWTSLGTWTDTTYSCSYIGFTAQDTTPRWTNFGGGSSSTPSVSTTLNKVTINAATIN